MSKNNVVIFVMVAIVLVVPNLANFENLFITTKITSFFSHKGRHVIKSIEILSNRPFEVGRGLYDLYFFLCIDFVP
jgi:hypothetical protein